MYQDLFQQVDLKRLICESYRFVHPRQFLMLGLKMMRLVWVDVELFRALRVGVRPLVLGAWLRSVRPAFAQSYASHPVKNSSLHI